jgi:hypothetical protein
LLIRGIAAVAVASGVRSGCTTGFEHVDQRVERVDDDLGLGAEVVRDAAPGDVTVICNLGACVYANPVRTKEWLMTVTVVRRVSFLLLRAGGPTGGEG